MKRIYKSIIVLSTLLSMVLTASAQVQQIWEPENRPTQRTTPKIKIENNSLYVITSVGVYSIPLDEFGNLTGETLLPSELFENITFEVSDLAVRGNTAFVVTPNTYSENNAILKTEDGGKTWVDINNWEDLDLSNYYQRSSLKRGELTNQDELFVIIGSQIYHTRDFGTTWSNKGVAQGEYMKTHPLDSKVSVSCAETMLDVISNKRFYISSNYGENWDYVGNGFVETNDVAYHYSNEDIIVLIGEPIMVSKDCGETWEVTKEFGYENKNSFILKSDFDTRGRDRLYGVRDKSLLYSDDFGANWSELCEIGSNIANFTQKGNKIYLVTKSYKVYQIDLEKLETFIDEVTEADSNVIAVVSGNQIHIEGVAAGAKVEVYSMNGVLVYSGTEHLITVDDKGIYIVRVGDERLKVVI